MTKTYLTATPSNFKIPQNRAQKAELAISRKPSNPPQQSLSF
jgi:hypothetical protein